MTRSISDIQAEIAFAARELARLEQERARVRRARRIGIVLDFDAGLGRQAIAERWQVDYAYVSSVLHQAGRSNRQRRRAGLTPAQRGHYDQLRRAGVGVRAAMAIARTVAPRGDAHGGARRGVQGGAMTGPLVSAEVDLRGLNFMPLFGDRLFNSTGWIEAGNDGRVAALRLLWHAYAHEVPAGSLPDSERVLAQHAGLSATVFRRIRDQALHGWISCEDGRLYHPILAEIVIDAWERRVSHRARALKWREKKAAVTVTSPSRDARQGQRQGQGQGQEETEEAAAADAAFALWQATARAEGWPDAMFLNSTRRWRLCQRLAQAGGLDGWRAALAVACRADFLKGPDGRFHRWFDLDWLLDEQKFTRLMEGRYDERRHARTHAAARGSALDATLAELGGAGPAAGR